MIYTVMKSEDGDVMDPINRKVPMGRGLTAGGRAVASGNEESGRISRGAMDKKSRILVVDDEEGNRRLMTALLIRLGYDVAIACNGEEALEKVKDTAPDLVLLDIMMPGMDGYEVCRRLKENSATLNLPVIFLTAMHQVEDEQKAFEHGAVDYITKPVRAPIVSARIKTHLQLRSAREYLEEKNQFLELTFSRYVSKKVIEQLKKTPVVEFLKMEKREVSVLFADLRGFTALGDRLASEDIQETVNSFLDTMVRCIEEKDGMVDKFMGDGLMALFGAPLRQDDHARRALDAAISMQKAHRIWMEERQASGKPVRPVGIGLAGGEVVLGNMGTLNRMEYTVLGHTANLASRLCSAADGGEILTTRDTWEMIKRHTKGLRPMEDLAPAKISFMTFKNIEQPVEVISVHAP